MKKRIRVGIFIEGKFLPSYDGANNRFHYLSKFLQESGKVDVVIFHCHRGYTDTRLLRNEKFTTYLLSEENYYNNLELLAFLINKEKIEILQFNDIEPILYQGVKLSKMTGAKLVYEIHYNSAQLAKTLGEKKEIVEEITKSQKKVGENIDHAICLSIDDVKDSINNLMITKGMIDVVPSGVDIRENKYHTPNLSSKTVSFLGNLYFQPNEDAVRMLKTIVFPELKKHGYSFIIAGDCPKKLKEELGEDNFKFIGTVKNLNSLFKKSTICVAPIFEGTGMRIKFLNFMSGGIPIITTSIATNGFPDKSNFIIEDDVKKYADKIINLVETKEIMKISKNSRKIIEDEYNWKKISEKVVDIYIKVLRKKTNKKTSAIKVLEKPAWLKELIKKGRYKTISELPCDFSFSKVKDGEIEEYKIKDIIAIEGMPGAGKTTFVNNLKNNNIKKRQELNINIPKKVKKRFEIQKLYLLNEIKKNKEARRFFKEYKGMVMDRSFISILAYTFAYCKTNNNMKDYEKIISLLLSNKDKILFPTKVVILDCSIEKSIERRKAFKDNPKYQEWFNKSFLNNFRKFYFEELNKIINVNTITIDTTNKSIKETDAVIKKELCLDYQ